MKTIQPARSLTVQIVLYQNSVRDVVRSVRALSRAASNAHQAGVLSTWMLRLGDSSEKPALDTAALAELAHHVESTGGMLEYEPFGSNLGHGGGHNRLAASADSDLLLFLNPDSVLAPDALRWLIGSLDSDVGAADARQLPFEHPKDFDTTTGDSSWASGSCFLTHRHAFEEVGGFDHGTFFLYCDDVDLSWRLKLAGYRIVHEPGARLFHDKRFDPDGHLQASDAERYYSAEAAVLLAWKYSRSDIAGAILAAFAESSDATLKRAREAVLARRAAGELPQRLDHEHRVAQFVSGNYAVHRF